MTTHSLDTPNNAETALTWDIYCHVVDNYGDVGVCWRLARNLVERGQTVRLFMDDASALAWMASSADKRNDKLHIKTWDQQVDQCGDVVIEAFGAQLPEQALKALGGAKDTQRKVCWLNLEYLSAEASSKANHGLDSPVAEGPAAGMSKQFFYPGFVRGTGGILRDKAATAMATEAPDLAWPPKRMALFSYDSPTLDLLIHQATQMGMTIQVAAGRTTAHVQQLADQGVIDVGNIEQVPHCTQQQFDAWLNNQDFLVVRGEDSLTRAILSGKPFLWHIYPQEDGAHRIKLNAFLDWLEAPVDMQHAFKTLNGTRKLRDDALMLPADIGHWHEWVACVRKARNKLLEQNDLVTRLLVHAHKVLA
ncbi:elongation factor P maturation arginine rhamnosyltransferase EarP [Comamonadaceae bacterium M7527]|nr:elongation factor P maturation arginine rhamnosyltransferase EarP [Comamonadaceae bacterium M7527]